MTEFLYFAHPVSPRGTETVESNVRDAKAILCALQRANPDVVIVAQWMLEIIAEIGRDDVPEERKAGLHRCIALAGSGVFSGIVVTGPRIGTGSLAEIRAVCSAGRHSRRLTTIHRVRNAAAARTPLPDARDCSPVHLLAHDRVWPYWLELSSFGAAPLGSPVMAYAELQAAIEGARS